MKNLVVRFIYTESCRRKNKTFLLVLFLVGINAIPLLWLILLFGGVEFKGGSPAIGTFVVTCVLQVFCICATILLFRFGYKGSYVPFAAVILLMGTGLVLQTRLEIYLPTSGISSPDTVSGRIKIDRLQGEHAGQPVPGELISLFTAYCLSVLALVGAVVIFWGKNIWFYTAGLFLCSESLPVCR